MLRMSVEEYEALRKRQGRAAAVEKIVVKTGKYRNKKTVVDGIEFDSKKEAARYSELKLMERSGEIIDLCLQVPFVIEINGMRVCKYIADFTYWREHKRIVEDVKSEATRKLPVYRLKNKLMAAVLGIRIEEV